MPRFARAAVAAAAGALLVSSLAACATSSSAAGTASPSASASVEPLVLYAAVAYDSDVAKAFTAKTGIPVKVVDDSTGPLLSKISAERNNPQWSMLWVDGATAFASLDKQGLLAPYAPTASLTTVGKAVQLSSHAATPTGVTLVPGMVYNAAAGGPVPTGWADLLTSAYKGKVGMNDPAQSGPTFPLIAGLMNEFGGQSNGVQKGEDYLVKLKANGLVVNPTNGDTLHALENGQIQYGLVQSSAAIGEVLSAKTSATFQPKVAYIGKATILPSMIGIDKKASATQQAEAKQFIDFVLTASTQKIMQGSDPAGDSLFYPIVSGVAPLAGVPAFPTSYQEIDPYFWGPKQAEIVSWFTQNIK